MCLCLCVGPVSPGVCFFMDVRVHGGKVTVWSFSDMRLLSSGLRALAWESKAWVVALVLALSP